jgi:choline dehydrogenase-like flavoprotein
MRLLPKMSFIGILTRDRFGGRVTVSRSGRPVVDYQVSRYDQRHVRRGVGGAARVLVAAGAGAIASTQVRTVSYRVGGRDRLEDWLARVDRLGYGPNRTLYSSFHQMGTCRMGGRRDASVVDGAGEVYAVRNLFVADASLFPTATGVNPMITVGALAHYVAQVIKSRRS